MLSINLIKLTMDIWIELDFKIYIIFYKYKMIGKKL